MFFSITQSSENFESKDEIFEMIEIIFEDKDEIFERNVEKKHEIFESKEDETFKPFTS
jgi:hypothetical protein